jgi:hypothetical protein
VNQFIEDCRREWRRLRVPKSTADEMAAELETDLAEARAEGTTPEELVGSDPRSFAAAWAAERGPRRRPTRMWKFAALALLVALAVTGATLLAFGRSGGTSQAAGPLTVALRPSVAPHPAAVTVTWVPRTARLVELKPSHDDRTLGYVLLLVGLTGTGALAAVSLWRPSVSL